MLIFMLLLGILIGTALGAGLVKRRQRGIESARYSELEGRWRSLLAIAHENGRITDEQFAELQAPKALGTGSGAGAPISQELLYSMTSADRRDLELDRADRGEPRFDDLQGMTSADMREVLQAHADNS